MNSIKSISTIFFVTLLSSFLACSCRGNYDDGKLSCWINEGNKFEGISKDSVWQAVEEECEVDLSISGATHNSDYYSILNPKIDSGEFPDIVFSVPSAQDGSYNDWVDEDIVWNYDELLAERPGEYPYLEQIFASENYKNIMYGDNMHTLLPYFTERSGWTIYYRSDWLKNIGYVNEDGSARYPVTMDEFVDVMQKFTENDPDGDGKRNTCGLSPAGSITYFNPLFHAFGVTTDYDLDENDDPIYQCIQPEFKNFLAWAHDMFEKEFIEDQFVTNSSGDDRDKFYNGTSGILITNGYSHVQYIIKKVEERNGKGTCIVGPAPIGTETYGKPDAHGFSDWGGWWGGFSISKECEDPDSALRFLNYINGPEGNTLFHYGILGKHYELDEEEHIVPDVDARGDEPEGTFTMVADEYGDRNPIGQHQLGAKFQASIVWDSEETEFQYVNDIDSIDYQYKGYYQQTVDLNTLYTSRLTNVTCWPSTFSSKMTKLKDLTDTFAIDAIMGNKNLTSDWDNLMQRLEKECEWSKIQKMIEEVAIDCDII